MSHTTYSILQTTNRISIPIQKLEDLKASMCPLTYKI
jgi:hypothetical protein